MKKPRASTIVLILLLLATNAFWLYGAIDQGVTLMYTESSYQYAQSNYEQLLTLSDKNLIGKSANEVMTLIPTANNGLEPHFKEGCLYYDQICLRLGPGNIIEGYGKNAL